MTEQAQVESEDLAQAIVEDVLDNLLARSGFDGWWDVLGVNIRREIRRDLKKTVMEARVR